MTKPLPLDRIERQISALFAEKLNIEVPSVDIDLIETGLVDSLMFVRFLAELETSFDVRVSLEDLEIEHFRTITRIAGFVAEKMPRVATNAAAGS